MPRVEIENNPEAKKGKLRSLGGIIKRDGTGQQLRSGKMAGTRMQNAMVGACHSVRARRDAPATPDCLMARMVPSKP